MDDRTTRRTLLSVVGAGVFAGCLDEEAGDGETGDESVDTATGSPTPAEPTTPHPDDYEHPEPSDDPDWRPADGSPLDADVEIEVLVENLEVPWDIAFGGDELFITERPGRIVRFDNDDVSELAEPDDAIDAGSVEPGADESPWWVDGGEGGTMGIATHPDFPNPSHVYVYYTADVNGIENRVVRYDVANDSAEDREVLVDGIPAANIHNGGRIAFGPDDNLWILTGDATTEDPIEGDVDGPRDPASLAGKVLRVTPDGDPAPGNPDFGADADPRVFTIGHRNPQGIDWLPSGVPIVSEHGPQARDEVNVLQPGGDYGWADARGGPDDDDYANYADRDYVPPLVNTGPSETWAPTGATFYTGDAVPEWTNRFLVGGLISQRVNIVTITPNAAEEPPADGGTRFDADWMNDSYQATAHPILEDELGRVRHLAESPDGELYAITSNRDGRAGGEFPTEQDDVLVRIRASE